MPDSTPIVTPPGPVDPSWNTARRLLGGRPLSVILPARNLAPVLRENVRRVQAAFGAQVPVEIIVVDDGSTDHTRQELERLCREFSNLKAVSLPQNMGKGYALKRGFLASSGAFILFLDADLDLPPEQASKLFEVMAQARADVVIGSKRHPDSVLTYPWHRRLISTVYYALVKLLIGLPVRDTQTGIKLFRREALEWALPRMLVKRFAFDLELLAIVHEKGFRIAESPVTLRFQGRWGCVQPTAIRQIAIDTLAVFYRVRILRYYQSLLVLEMPTPAPLVSIVIACPAATAYVEECLAGIARQSYRNYEVLLLPDAPSGRTWTGPVQEIPTGRCRPAEKRYRALQQVRGDLVAMIDDDACPADHWLEHALVYFSDPQVAAVGGPATTPGSDPFLAKLSGRVYANPLVSGNYRYRYEPERVREVEDLPSCNLIVRTAVMRQLGGFRTDYWPGEDTYLCMEIVKRLGLKIMYEPRAEVTHHRRPLFLPHLRQIARYALHRGYFARRFPATSRRISYLLPSLFVLGTFFGGIAAVLSPVLCLLYLGVLGLYGALTLIASFSFNPAAWLLTWLGICLTHLVYGARFLVGLLSRRMPSEVARFDHPSEQEATPS
jgi:cellulose synthase/poly-beta-1,6-N-acetylglucosamine synthase-like glycosyltransferase